jgi:hypothetical protein
VRRAAFDDLLAACARSRRTIRRWTSRPRRAGRAQALVAAGRLEAAEDEIDAYVCAYVAIYHRRWHGRRSLVVATWPRVYRHPGGRRRRHRAPAWGARLAVPSREEERVMVKIRKL